MLREIVDFKSLCPVVLANLKGIWLSLSSCFAMFIRPEHCANSISDSNIKL
jgi:hypothetical protein